MVFEMYYAYEVLNKQNTVYCATYHYSLLLLMHALLIGISLISASYTVLNITAESKGWKY
jgi:hypothetical protein